VKIKNIFLWNLLWGIIYFGTNNINLFAPHELPLLSLEKNIAMNEWWMIPYMSWFFYNIIFCLLIKKDDKKFTLAMTGLVLIHAFAFILFPTEYPRTYDYDSLSWLSKIFLNCDNPQNCLPSLHVSFVFFTLLIASYLGIAKKVSYIFIVWGVIIMTSVVFVKQHYLIDVLAGIIVTTIYFYSMLIAKILKFK